MLHVLFVVLVILGFALMLASRWPVGSPYAERGAWACWTAAALIWDVGELGSR